MAGLLLPLALWTMWTAPPAQAQGPDEARPELTFIERLYREGDAYRAETEALRFLAAHPRHPQRAAVQLARAKLYYRAGRYGEANLILYSLLDRAAPPNAAPPDTAPSDTAPPNTVQEARRLLAFAHLRGEQPARAAETADALAGTGAGPNGGPEAGPNAGSAPTAAELTALSGPAPGAVDVDAAVGWSTWLPGSGYALLGQPGKAAAGITLNVGLLGLVGLSLHHENAAAALLFLALEGMLWQGGRSGVRQDAEAINRRLRERRLEAWLERHGEPELLGVGIALHFGGG